MLRVRVTKTKGLVDAVREIGDKHVGETWLTRRWSLYNSALLLAPTTISTLYSL